VEELMGERNCRWKRRGPRALWKKKSTNGIISFVNEKEVMSNQANFFRKEITTKIAML